ncbi:hypothetical protein KVR01_013193 [Diaporthe batatas]|uniref:uncharacterized protein n=1 Tax=Diaporthe batatas TaxID=748121 RepID=UPI001D052068|nr:uncharacterized protein KVR01_013193 [Diaporthe batatas]KAG8156971.1 hypothetical protein KVR01_013193 [Diaporthe batatas]
MLLRQAEPADVDGYISAAAAAMSDSPTQDTTTTTTTTDTLDDVFGSDGDDDTPVFEEEDNYNNHDNNNNTADIRTVAGRPTTAAHHHPSDIHRLRQSHATAGYREGITAAKAGSVQAGFDEGFGVGGAVGLRVGWLLGVLEGVAAALGSSSSSSSSSTADEAGEARAMLASARAELDLRGVFGPEYWGEDGIWRYEVGGGEGGQEGEEGEVLFSHVAEAHPLVRKWTAAVEGVMARWGVEGDLPLLRRREGDDGDEQQQPVPAKAVAPARPDAKAASDALSW